MDILNIVGVKHVYISREVDALPNEFSAEFERAGDLHNAIKGPIYVGGQKIIGCMSYINWAERTAFLQSNARCRVDYYNYRRKQRNKTTISKTTPPSNHDSGKFDNFQKLFDRLNTPHTPHPHVHTSGDNTTHTPAHRNMNKSKKFTVATGSNAIPVHEPRFIQLSIDNEAEWNPWSC